MGSVPGSSATGAGVVFNAVGDILGGFSEAGQLNAKAQIARNNAIIARQNASGALGAGEVRAEAQGLKNRAQQGAIKAGQAASGVDVNAGSAVDVRQSAAMLGAHDMMMIRSNAARQAYGYELEGLGQEQQSKLYRKGAKIAPWEGGFNAVGSLLGGASKLSEMSKAWEQSAGSGGGGGLYPNMTNDAGEAIWD